MKPIIKILIFAVATSSTAIEAGQKKTHDRNHQNNFKSENQANHSKKTKRPKKPTIPIDPPQVFPSKPVVRDHRGDTSGQTPATASGGVVVTKTPSKLKRIVRDHRKDAKNQTTSNASGGVVVSKTPTKVKTPFVGSGTVYTPPVSGRVTTSPFPSKTKGPKGPFGNGSGKPGSGVPNDVIGVGPNPISAVGNLIGDAVGAIGGIFGLGSGTITPVGGSTPKPPPPGPTIRDHRS